jgi:hypothetical protein
LAQVPQWFASIIRLTSQPLAGSPSQSAKPAAHASPQRVPSHVGVAFGPPVQGVHDVPQLSTDVLLEQTSPQRWKPVLQKTRHAPAAHVDSPFVTSGHALLHAPQWRWLDARLTHWLPQSVGASPVQPFVQTKVGPTGAQFGATCEQVALHEPHVAGAERSVSHPSAAVPLQFS